MVATVPPRKIKNIIAKDIMKNNACGTRAHPSHMEKAHRRERSSPHIHNAARKQQPGKYHGVRETERERETAVESKNRIQRENNLDRNRDSKRVRRRSHRLVADRAKQ